MNKSNKRMVYIRPDNIEFYDNLENKSKIINDYLSKLRQEEKVEEEVDYFDAIK